MGVVLNWECGRGREHEGYVLVEQGGGGQQDGLVDSNESVKAQRSQQRREKMGCGGVRESGVYAVTEIGTVFDDFY